MSANTRSAPLSVELADRLLDLLSTDDDYRTRFQRDPRAALHEIGYRSPSQDMRMTACGAIPAALPEALIDCRVEELASKEAIGLARDEIRTMLTRGLAQTPPRLEADSTAVRRLRR